MNRTHIRFIMIIMPLVLFANSALGIEIKLKSLGSTAATQGKIIHVPKSISNSDMLFAIEGDQVLSPFEQKPISKLPSGGKVILEDAEACLKSNLKGIRTHEKDEKVVAKTQIEISGQTYELILMGKSKLEKQNDLPVKSTWIELYQSGKKVHRSQVPEEDIYPCGLLRADLDKKKGEELAITWISIGGGYSVGVSIFEISK